MRKYCLLIALLTCLIYLPLAQAGTLFTIPNRGGGDIQFTDTDCPNRPGQAVVFAVGSGGKITVAGCWTMNGDYVLVRWNDGDDYTYPLEDGELTDYGQRLLDAEQKPKTTGARDLQT